MAIKCKSFFLLFVILLGFQFCSVDALIPDPTETRYMRNALTENKQYATGYNIIYGTLSSGSLANLQASDNVYMVFASALVSSMQQISVEFSGTHSGYMPFLQCLIEGKTTGSACTITVYNYTKGGYETSGTMYLQNAFSTSDTTKYLYSLYNCTDYRDANGNWKIKISGATSGTPPPSWTLSIDYLYYCTVAFQLGTSQTTMGNGNDVNVAGSTIGIRAWKLDDSSVETEIGTVGTNKATVVAGSKTEELDGTWTPPETSSVSAILIKVYKGASLMREYDYSSGGLPFYFITETLNATLSSVLWTVHYSFVRDGRVTYFMFGSSTYNSRITNFQWTVGGYSYVQIITEIIECYDTCTKHSTIVKTELIRIYDTITKHPIIIKAETININDIETNHATIIKSEQINILDNIVKDILIVRTDAINLFDIIVKDITLITTETINIFDIISCEISMLISEVIKEKIHIPDIINYEIGFKYTFPRVFLYLAVISGILIILFFDEERRKKHE